MIKQLKKTGVLFTLLVLMMNACNLKDKYKNDNPIATNQVTASIIGVVKDELGQAIPNTTVMIGANIVMSDANGIYIFNKIDCNQKATTVRFMKQGYFNGFKTLSVQANEKHIANVSLLKKENPQILNAQNGGTVNSGNGIMITFPANALVNKNTGAVYNGQANVFIKKIDPTTEIGQKTMPGNLTGLNTNSQEMLLQSFGMLAAEIEDNNGNLLQIVKDKEATISSEIPASLLAQAKSTIPLWYFDETKMQWVEEGSATLNGTKYEGNVKHFSFWNYDAQLPSISVELTLVDQFGNPLQGYYVSLHNSNNIGAHGITNSNGWIGGLAQSNATLTLNVYSESSICGSFTQIYTQTVVTSSININLGTISVPLNTSSATTISGSIVDCLGNPISNSVILIMPYYIIVSANALGQFTYSFPCTPSLPLTIYAYDITNNVFGTATTTLVSGINNLGSLNACGSINPYLNINITNTSTSVNYQYTFNVPASLIKQHVSGQIGNSISAVELNQNYGLYLTIADSSIGTHAVTYASFNFPASGFTDSTYNVQSGSTVTYTDFPLFPGDVLGSYSLNLIGIPSGNNYTVTGSFRALRDN